MQKKLQVFISSTFTDMREERQAAVEAILQAGHIPAGMELFAAGSESQLVTIKQWIDDSDVFMLLLGGRYGMIEPKSGKSYIETEYRYAAKSKPFFAVCIEDVFLKEKVQARGVEFMEMEHPDLRKTFVELVKSKTCTFYNNLDQLKLQVYHSLSIHARDGTIQGWVRSGDVVSPKPLLDQIERLQGENSLLTKRVAELEGASARQKSAEGGASLAASLSVNGVTLLVHAGAPGRDGRIFMIHTSAGLTIMAGGNFNILAQSAREEAMWKSALKQLLEYNLIEDVGHKGESFQLTQVAFSLLDSLNIDSSDLPTIT